MKGSQTFGPLSQTEPGAYAATVVLPPVATEGVIAYQFGSSSNGTFGRPGEVAPFLVLPTVALDEPLLDIDVSPAEQAVRLTLSELPIGAGSVVVVVDNDELAVRQGFESGALETQPLRLGLPVGSYRLRAIAAPDSGRFRPILGAAVAQDVTVGAGQEVALSLTWAEPSVAVAESSPVAITPASALTIELIVEDPGQFLSDSLGRLYTGTDPFDNLEGDQHWGTLTPISGTTLSYSATLTSPAETTTLHFQFGESGGSIWGGDGWVPFLVGPDVARSQPLFTIAVE